MADEPKVLTVSMDYHEPKYTFTGFWSGRDIRVVMTHMTRAYRQYQKDLRDGMEATAGQSDKKENAK